MTQNILSVCSHDHNATHYDNALTKVATPHHNALTKVATHHHNASKKFVLTK